MYAEQKIKKSNTLLFLGESLNVWNVFRDATNLKAFTDKSTWHTNKQTCLVVVVDVVVFHFPENHCD